MARFDIPTPDVGEKITLTKGGPKTKLDHEQYERYRSEALTKIYQGIAATMADGVYQKADPETKKQALLKIIRKQRAAELKETKGELQGAQ
jgi:hypothetical protein